MKKLEIKTRKNNNTPQYNQNLDICTVFLRHPDDRITIINGQTVNFEIYNNGKLIFLGDKGDLFEILENSLIKEMSQNTYFG